MTGRTISGTQPLLVTLSGAGDNPATILSDGALTSGLYGSAGTTWTVTNAGSVGGSGVQLVSGGRVANQSGGTIAGTHGIRITGGAGTVVASGGITGSSDAIMLAAGFANLLLLNPDAAVSGLVDGGNTIGATAASTLELASAAGSGTIAGLGSQFVHFSRIVVDTGASWTIGSANLGAGYTITNRGSLTNAGTLSSAVTLGVGAVLTNAAGGVMTPDAAAAIYGPTGGAATVVNAGSIGNASAYGIGINMRGGGRVTNLTGASIGGYSGIVVLAAAGTVTNDGTIGNNATSGIGVHFAAGGVVTNNSTGLIRGNRGVNVAGAAGTIGNAGLILGNTASGSGVYLGVGGAVTNQSGGTIAGYAGVIALGSTGTVINGGRIAGADGGRAGVDLRVGGQVTNVAGGTISGFSGIYAFGAAGTVVNAGAIAGGTNGSGVQLAPAGAVTNQSGGTIVGGLFGVNLTGGGSVSNLSGGTISGGYGVYLQAAAGTILNAGSIGGVSAAIRFASGYANRLIVNPGAAFSSAISGGNTIGSGVISTLEFGSAATHGTVSGLGTQFVDFQSVTLDAGAYWVLTGDNTLPSGSSFTNNGTLKLLNATLTEAGTLTNNGVILIDPSTLTVGALDGSGTLTIAADSTLAVQGAVSSGTTLVFEGSGTRLRLGTPDAFAGTLSGFTDDDSIDLAGVAPASVTLSGGSLTFGMTGGGTGSIALSPAVSGTFTATSNGSGGALLTALCFLGGTRIATPSGEMAVEDLKEGDLVRTWAGGTRRVTWLGTGRVQARPGRRDAATPVIVRRHAIAQNVPCRDLHVTKGHSLFLDDVLIPVEFLINHRSIQWDDRAREARLFHVELDRHDILIADGAPAESYRDDGNRRLFDNANSGWALPPQEPCAPVLTGGAIVDRVWRRLLDRSGHRPGLPVTLDPDLHVRIDGRRIDPIGRDNGRFRFRLPRTSGDVRIVSRSAAPQELGLSRDPRALGVAIERIVLWRFGWQPFALEADDPGLTDGFHGFEPLESWRWTDGDAGLPPSLLRHIDDGCVLELCVRATGSYAELEAA